MKFVFFEELDTGKEIAIPATPESVIGIRQVDRGTEIQVQEGYVYKTPTGIRVVAQMLEEACPDIIESIDLSELNENQDSRTVRCKMTCQSFKKSDNDETSESRFIPVYSGSTENEDFFKYTPAGQLDLSVLNDNVKFEEGQEYYIDIIKAN